MRELLCPVCDSKDSKPKDLSAENEIKFISGESEEEIKIKCWLINTYRHADPIKKYAFKLFVKQAQILLRDGPIQLPMGLEDYD